MKNVFAVLAFLTVFASNANATNDDRGIYCLTNQPNLINAVRALNTKFENRDNFVIPLSQGSSTLQNAELLGVAVDSHTSTRWNVTFRAVAVGSLKMKFPILSPQEITRYDVCVALKED